MTLEADAALIAVGTWVRSKTIVNSYDEPVAGICCETVDTIDIDDETGEVTDVTVYRCRDCNDPDPLRARIFHPDDVDPAECYPASTYDIARLARRICFEIGKAKRTSRAAREINAHEAAALTDVVAVLRTVS